MEVKMVLRQLLLLLLLGITTTGHEYYSSTEEMEDLATLDQALIANFAMYIRREMEHIHTLNRVLKFLKGLSEDYTRMDLSDPITAYQLVNQIRVKFYTIWKYTKQLPSEAFLEHLSSVHEDLPDEQEVDGVALGLLRIQEIYRLEPQSIMGYDPAGIEEASRLDPDECFHVAKVAYDNEKYQLACLWLQESFQLLQRGIKADVSIIDLRKLFASSAFKLGDVDTAIGSAEWVVNEDPTDEEAQQQLWNYLIHRATRQDFFGPVELFRIPAPSSYQALCRSGHSRMTPRRQRALFCRYSTAGGNPRLMYAPVKEEDEWDHPRIVRYHDFLSEQEMDMIKTMARPQLVRSSVFDGENKGYVDKSRVSKTAWLGDDDDPLITHISQRMADITGLDTGIAESLQVLNYGVGGHYRPHHDAPVQNKKIGDRIATIMIYLSDVEVGGATVFPEVGAALQPIKGSAVLWFNLLQNGEVDDLTLHSGCPVFRGNKWVANKWVHERGQEFRRRCSLNHWE